HAIVRDGARICVELRARVPKRAPRGLKRPRYSPRYQMSDVRKGGRHGEEDMLYAEHVAKSFGRVDVLHDVTFIASDGERIGLVGANGAGKSTILRLIAGEDRPDEGGCGHGGGALGYLRQEAAHEPERELVAELWTAFPEAASLQRELEQVVTRIEG